MDDACAVCAEPIEWVAYGACGHREVCSVCVARLRFVLRDQRCCLCMTHCPAVFVTKALGDRTKVISDLSVLPAPAGEGKVGEYWYHEGTQVWFDDVEQYRAVRAMCQISCTVCKDSTSRGNKGSKASKAKHKKKIGSMEQLKGHLFNHHQLYMCDLCLDGRKVFSTEQKLYTRPQLNKHMKNGDPEVDGSKVERKGFRGHPMCEFCKIPFYGQDEIYTHMTREHYSCHMCQRQHCRNDDYFRNYDELEMHFRSDHFFCEDRECLEKKFIVFQSEAELKRHNAVEHKERKPHANKNATTFKVLGRGSGIQAASVPVYLRPISGQASQAGQSSGPNRVLQQSYSSLSRQEVSGTRIGSGFQEASSPPVSEQSRHTPALSRSSRTAAIIRDEEFPPLSGSSNRSPALTQRVVRKVAENTHASGLRQQSKGVSVQLQSPENTDSIPSGSRRSPSCPTPNPSCPMPNPSTKISGSLSLTSAENERLAANTFLVERMQTALGMDHDRYVMFKEISGEYHQGVINASSYLLYVEQFGLSHLVLEMARLLPDPHKQKELADAYYANLRLTSLQGNGGGGTVSSRKNKGKGKLPDAAETTSPALNSMKDKFLSTANKLQLQGGDFGALLREGCGATVKGARQSHGGHRLSLSKTKK